MVGKFVEFYGPGVSQLSIGDRATISNMCPEYGATVGFFPVDDMSMKYLKQTGNTLYVLLLIVVYYKCVTPWDSVKIEYIEAYLKTNRMYRNYDNPTEDPVYSEVISSVISTYIIVRLQNTGIYGI